MLSQMTGFHPFLWMNKLTFLLCDAVETSPAPMKSLIHVIPAHVRGDGFCEASALSLWWVLSNDTWAVYSGLTIYVPCSVWDNPFA
jgi:hypothetical protein